MSCPFRLVPEQVGPRESRFLGLAQRMSLGLLVLAPAVCEWIVPLPESVTGGSRLLHIFFRGTTRLQLSGRTRPSTAGGGDVPRQLSGRTALTSPTRGAAHGTV